MHLQSVEDMTGEIIPELHTEMTNRYLYYLLEYFYDLSLSRQYGMTSNPILYSEILAWCNLTDTQLEKWELDVIKRLDLIWLNVQND